MTPTQRSLALLRERNWAPWVVERWIAPVKRRLDLWNVIDILCMTEGHVIGVQTTSGSNVSARVKKIRECEYFEKMKAANIQLLVHGWRKNSKNRWVLREIEVV